MIPYDTGIGDFRAHYAGFFDPGFGDPKGSYAVLEVKTNELPFILEDGQEGFSYGKKENKMGWRTSPTRELVFENCFVPQGTEIR